MKRGGPLRRTELKRGSSELSRSTPLPSRRANPKPRRVVKRRSAASAFDAEFDRAKANVRVRSRGYCEGSVSGICSGTAQHCHHRKRRSQGGTNVLGNLLDLCFACHEWAHRNPADAVRLGLIIPSWQPQ